MQQSTLTAGVPLTSTSVDVNSGVKIKNNYFDGLPVSRSHVGLFMLIVLAYFFEQLDNNNFSFVAPALISSWGIKMEDIAHINSLYFVGMTLGGLLGGVISDFIGRRKTFLGSIVLFSVASIANGFAQDLTTFAISRAITGFGIFCMMVVSIAYISEMTPAESRGKDCRYWFSGHAFDWCNCPHSCTHLSRFLALDFLDGWFRSGWLHFWSEVSQGISPLAGGQRSHSGSRTSNV